VPTKKQKLELERKLGSLARRLVSRRWSERHIRSGELEKMGPDERLLIARMNASADDEYLRTDAADDLGLYGQPQDAFRVRTLTKDPSWFVRSSAGAAAAQVFKKKAERILCRLLTDKEIIVRRDAAWEISNLDLTRSIPSVEKQLMVETHPHASVPMLYTLIRFGRRELLSDYLAIHQVDCDNADFHMWLNLDVLLFEINPTPAEIELVWNTIKEARLLPQYLDVEKEIDKFVALMEASYPRTDYSASDPA